MLATKTKNFQIVRREAARNSLKNFKNLIRFCSRSVSSKRNGITVTAPLAGFYICIVFYFLFL
jgi:hypothetical protein